LKRITKIEIENFRAFFGSYKVDLPKGENLLVYGENGSGKSSLFKALNNYLSSSRDATFIFIKNHYRPPADNGLIKITFMDADPVTHAIQAGTVQDLDFGTASITHRVNFVKDTELIKGFLDYRSLLDIYNHDKPNPNLFELIVLNILKNQLNVARTFRFGTKWEQLQNNLLHSYTSRVRAHQNALAELPVYENALRETLRRIFRYLNNVLLSTYFNELNIQLRFELQPITFNYSNWKSKWSITKDFRLRVIQNGSPVQDDYSDFLNEARLSAFAVCIYLAALKTNPELIDYKILFLDDVFIGLDATNRLPILKIVQHEFKDYQVILTTYDRHTYELAKRRFEIEVPDEWVAREFYVGNDVIGVQKYEMPIVVEGKTYFDSAVQFLHHREKPDYPAASNYFRKSLEETIKELVPPYETTDAEATQIPDHKLNKLVFATKNFLNKTGNPDTHINSIAGLLSTLLHPLSHHQISSPVYKGELMVIQREIPKLQQQLKLIDHTTNFKVMLEFKKHLKLTFNINAAVGHFIYYELVSEENLLKKLNGAALPTLSTCRCRTVKCYGENAGAPLPQFSPGKDDVRFHYLSLENAYNVIHAFLVNLNGPFPREANYLDAIEYHDGTNWQPLNNLRVW